MKIGSLFPEKKARIEIIPLIDIMFFLLASFMMASLSLMRLQSLKMNLPSAAVARPNNKADDMVRLSVDKVGNISIDKRPYSMPDAQHYLSERFRTNANLSVFIIGDPDATHEMIVNVLDAVKASGVDKVSFDIGMKAASK